jgi:hypothetical protein
VLPSGRGRAICFLALLREAADLSRPTGDDLVAAVDVAAVDHLAQGGIDHGVGGFAAAAAGVADGVGEFVPVHGALVESEEEEEPLHAAVDEHLPVAIASCFHCLPASGVRYLALLDI